MIKSQLEIFEKLKPFKATYEEQEIVYFEKLIRNIIKSEF